MVLLFALLLLLPWLLPLLLLLLSLFLLFAFLIVLLIVWLYALGRWRWVLDVGSVSIDRGPGRDTDMGSKRLTRLDRLALASAVVSAARVGVVTGEGAEEVTGVVAAVVAPDAAAVAVAVAMVGVAVMDMRVDNWRHWSCGRGWRRLVRLSTDFGSSAGPSAWVGRRASFCRWDWR